ncbi:MAG TPA: STAS domain-containing protein [Mollicutes bacterium]|nr:STAS domain-containing protein [Mollicutes bacterium]
MLDIDTEFRKGILFVRLKGSLSYDNCHLLENSIGQLITENKVRFVAFNIYELYYIDSVGISTLLKYNMTLLKKQGIALICGENKMLFKIRNKDKYQIKEVNDELSAIKYINLGGYL